MKSNLTTSVLLGVLAVSALASVILCILWLSTVRQSRDLQQKVAAVNQSMEGARRLAAEMREYSKRNPAIDPILIKFQVKEATSPSAAPQPATR